MYRKKRNIATILQQNWLYIVGFVLLFFPLFRFIRGQIAKNKIQATTIQNDVRQIEVKNPVNVTQIASQIKTSQGEKQVAQNFAHYLGFIYKWYDPQRITTSKDQQNFIRDYNRLVNPASQMPKISRLYHEVYAVGRNLQNDARSALSDENFRKIKFF